MASKSYPRAKRVGQQIQRALSELIRRELRDPRLGMITLTDVRMSPDLGYATVYYSVLVRIRAWRRTSSPRQPSSCAARWVARSAFVTAPSCGSFKTS